MRKKKQGIGAFLKKLDLDALGISSDIVKDILQIEKAVDRLGTVKKKLVEKDKGLAKEFDRVMEKEIKRQQSKEKTLFPNTIPSNNFAISTVISDPHAKMLVMDDEDFSESYENGKIVAITLGKNKRVVLGHKAIRPEYFMGTVQEFSDYITKWQDPRIIQHWCCCWNWACENKSFFFPYVPINDILATVYAPPKNGLFCMRDRRAFSKSLNFLHNATIEIPVIVETTTRGGKKKKEQAVKMFRLFDLNLAKKNKKGDVYLKIAGQLLPGLNPGKFRGRLFPKGIFQLDPNPGRDINRISLAYRMCNRMDQINGEPLEWSLDYIIRAAGLEASSLQNRSEACNKLTKTLRRLVEVKCLGSFEPEKISAKTESVTLYPIL